LSRKIFRIFSKNFSKKRNKKTKEALKKEYSDTNGTAYYIKYYVCGVAATSLPMWFVVDFLILAD
jgi:hypothetical protein